MGIKDLKARNNRTYLNCLGARKASSPSEEETEFFQNEKVSNKKNLNKMHKPIQDKSESISSKISTIGTSSNNRINLKFNPESDKLISKYVNGVIKVQDNNRIIFNTQGSLYMNFKLEKSTDTQGSSESQQLKNIPRFMKSVWQMKSPKIIIPIITGIKNFKNWKNQKLEEQFQQGIIKLANKTDIWFITNGINGGISSIIGEAFNEEKASRNIVSKSSHQSIDFLNSNEPTPPPLTLLGIISASTLQNYSSFDGVTPILTASGNKTNKNMLRFDINPDHTHFIIYDDLSESMSDTTGFSSVSNLNNLETLTYCRFRDKMESLLTRSLNYYKKNRLASEASEEDNEVKNLSIEKRQIPMVCLVVRGDLNSIDAIDFKIRNQIPVVVLKGSGAVSDIIAFAYEELNENKDIDHEENFIRPELSKKLLDEFKDDLSKNEVVRNQYRDKIMSIAKNSSSKGGQKFLTIVDTKGLGFDYTDLDKYILTALLQSQTQLSGKQGKAQLERNLKLTLDWNCPALALSEIFQRDDYTNVEIKHSIFENAILRRDREEFVELFLDQGFYIHRYLGRNNIRELFIKAENREFFVTIILQGVLGHYTDDFPENFLPDGLNDVLKELTSIDNMINILEIYMNQLGLYITDVNKAEKKALTFMIIFAVLFNRHKLAKILWKRTEDPLAIALVCSLIYKNLLTYCQESYLKAEIEKYQKNFAESAIGVLDTSFKDNDPRTYSILTYEHPDWNDCTVLELAYNAQNLDFIAHPACQKILTKKLFGSIQIRDIDNGIIDFPAWLKVIISAFFVFPMYYWIVFPFRSNSELNSLVKEQMIDEFEDEEKDDELEEAEQTRAELGKKLVSEIKKLRKHSSLINRQDIDWNKTVTSTDNLYKSNNSNLNKKKANIKSYYRSPPIYEKIYLIWSSPFTKFWTNFLSYICFLMLFAYVTLWPCCGHLVLDSLLWLWTATITIENTRIAYKNYLTGSQLPMKFPVIEIAVMLLFLIAFFLVRIYGVWDGVDMFGMNRIFVSKGLLCVFLLYFFYRTLFIFLPISHQLGPMLVRMKLMVKQDFMIYLRLFLISMTAGSIALNAVLYPFHPVNFDLFKKILLLRGFMQLFVADKTDLERETEECRQSGLSINLNKPYSCYNLTNGLDFSYTQETLESYGVSTKCNNLSLLAWFILIQYFLLIKLFLPTLLTAMFSATGARINEKSEQLWMFQRYEIVLDYENRLCFPPPFTIIIYIFYLFKTIFVKTKKMITKCKVCAKCFCLEHRMANGEVDKKNPKADLSAKSCNSFNYWRNVAQRYSSAAEKDTSEKSRQKQVETNFNKVREDLSSQKKSMQRLNDRVISLEKAMIQNQSCLEQIKNLITQKQSKSGLLDRKKRNYTHILSRESPYVNTNVPRFFVYEKLVTWEIAYEFYDPPFIVVAPENFKIDKIFIDHEINLKVKDEIKIINIENSSKAPLAAPIPQPPNLTATTFQRSISKTSNKEQNQSAVKDKIDTKTSDQSNLQRKASQTSLGQPKQNIYLWNAVCYIDNPMHAEKKITINRKSWITIVDEQTSQSYPVIYSLDSIGFPRNPMGRTGVRGRGALLRYGPNHEIMAIVTRWKKQKNKPIYVERRKLLEFIAVKDSLTGLTKIPGDRILGDESKYSVVCRTFMEMVFEENDVERCVNFEEDDMMSFFASFASQTPIANQSGALVDILNDVGFVPTMIYKGYIDDPRNTDNAWVEAEIWNFHYDKDDLFDPKINNTTCRWRELSSNVRINSNEIISDALKEISEIHNSFFN